MNSSKEKEVVQAIEKEALFGVLPVLKKEKIYSFMEAFLVLSGYCIATWSYTQGAYLTTLVGFKQLLIGAFFGAILMLAIYQLPVILSVRYGIDIWIWLRSVLGRKGVLVLTVVIILINFPWYAVCADLFASSMSNLLGLADIEVGKGIHLMLQIFCVFLGTFIAYRGIGAINWTTKILVPLLLTVGVIVVIIGFINVPFDYIWNFIPENTGYGDSMTPYIISIEANFAFVITLVGGMAEVPRLTKKENHAVWAGVLGQGLSGSFFVVVGAVMAIAMQYTTGKVTEDPTLMLATLTVPAVGLLSLLLVAFANIGTQAVGSYIYGVMIKSSFKKANYKVIIFVLAAYVTVLCCWGKVVEYFGSFLTIGACVYAPLAAVLFADFFIVRKQKISLKSAYGLKGHNAYEYTKGFNIVGLVSIIIGIASSIAVYNPLSGVIHNKILFYLTPTGCGFIASLIIYVICDKIPFLNRYMHKDSGELIF